MASQIQLSVHDALFRDIGMNVAPLSEKQRKMLGVSAGDLVALKYGKRAEVLRVINGYTRDENMAVVRLDEHARQNLGVLLGESVVASSIKPPVAKKVLLRAVRPRRLGLFGDMSSLIKERFTGKPLVEGNYTHTVFLGMRFDFYVERVLHDRLAMVGEKTELIID